ncbi:MAG: 5-formyltetrahydrofolate cyclo-ligase [Paracoccaceae bacterium]
MTRHAPTDLKKAARAAAFARRRAAHAESAAADPAATRRLLDFVSRLENVRIVSGYLPIRTEIDPVAAMSALFGQGKRVCVPVIRGSGQPLDFREWTPDAALQDGPFGAKIPREGKLLRPDLLIVPLVAFDEKCYRLGYGGGFYDRTLEKLRASGRAIAIGLAYDGQCAPDLPVDPTDQMLDGIVTERSIYSPQ